MSVFSFLGCGQAGRHTVQRATTMFLEQWLQEEGGEERCLSSVVRKALVTWFRGKAMGFVSGMPNSNPWGAKKPRSNQFENCFLTYPLWKIFGK